MNRYECRSIDTVDDCEFSDVSMVKINTHEGGASIEIYPSVCKTISLSLEELKNTVEEIEMRLSDEA